jgi:hypothetical protein
MSATKIVYQTDHNGYFVGQTQADESPLEPGVFLIPGGCVVDPPPSAEEGYRQRLVDGVWTAEKIPEPDPPEEPEPVPAEQNAIARDTRLSYATLRAAPLKYAVDMGIATADERSRLEAWMAYAVSLSRMTVTSGDMEWPEAPAS